MKKRINAKIAPANPHDPADRIGQNQVYLTADGRRLCIGGPGATPEVAGFVQILQEGQTYNFPEAFLEYRSRQSQKR